MRCVVMVFRSFIGGYVWIIFVMVYLWGTYKIATASILHFDKNPGRNKSSFLMMKHSEKEFDKSVKEIDLFLFQW